MVVEVAELEQGDCWDIACAQTAPAACAMHPREQSVIFTYLIMWCQTLSIAEKYDEVGTEFCVRAP
jgi:hypothetical protein